MILYTDTCITVALGHVGTDATVIDKNARDARQARQTWTPMPSLQHKLPQEEADEYGGDDDQQ